MPTITVKVPAKATLENLNEIFKNISNHTGCRTCGLVGYDVYFRGDPAPDTQLLVNKLQKETPGFNIALEP